MSKRRREGRASRWGAGLLYSVVSIIAIKIWGWMEIQSNSVRREIKRVELQLVSLSNRLEKMG